MKGPWMLDKLIPCDYRLLSTFIAILFKLLYDTPYLQKWFDVNAKMFYQSFIRYNKLAFWNSIIQSLSELLCRTLQSYKVYNIDMRFCLVTPDRLPSCHTVWMVSTSWRVWHQVFYSPWVDWASLSWINPMLLACLNWTDFSCYSWVLFAS